MGNSQQCSVCSVQSSVFRSFEALFLLLGFLMSFAWVATLKAELLYKETKKSDHQSPTTALGSAEHFFKRHAEGWHWYQDPLSGSPLSESVQNRELPKADLSKTDLPKVGSDQKKRPLNPTEVIEDQRKKLEKKLHAAIIEPTRENIVSYILAQKAVMDQSQRFSESWKRVVMTTPSLDETLVHPVDQNAQHVYYGEKNKELDGRIKALAQEYGLFFFFKEKCSYCHAFAPVVKHFAKKHGWSVMAISMDGGVLPEFPQSKRDNGISERLQIAHVPALIALHPKTGKLIPLAYGMVSESEIEERIDLLTRAFHSEGVKQ